MKINCEQPGLYHGSFTVTSTDQPTTFIPVKIAIKPNFYKVAIWVIDDIASSVLAWNLIGYLFLEKRLTQTGNKHRMYSLPWSPQGDTMGGFQW